MSEEQSAFNLRIVDSCQCCVNSDGDGVCILHHVLINANGWTTICDDYKEYKGENNERTSPTA